MEKLFQKFSSIGTIKICVIFYLIFGCDKLDEEPLTNVSTEQFYSSETDALAALNGAYSRLKSGNGYYKQLFLSALFASSDQGWSTYLFKDFKTGTITNTNSNLTPIWRDIYLAIRDANNVIAKVPNIDMDEDLKLRIIGEAKFLRALHYFNLVRCFGEVPLRTQPVKDADENGLPLSPIVDIYRTIIEDLEFASINCWDRDEKRSGHHNNLGRVTNTAANAMLAKVYLRIASAKRTAMDGIEGNYKYLSFTNDTRYYYELAKVYSDLALEGLGFSLEVNFDGYSSIFNPENGNNPEMIFDVQGSSIVGQGTAVSNLFSPKDSGLCGSGWGGSNKLKPKFINFLMDKSDNRFQSTIIKSYENNTRFFELNPGSVGYVPTILETGERKPNQTLWQTWTSKYIDTEATTEYTSRQNWHVIRLADVYLMRAEAIVEITQDPSLANDDFNILRSRAGVNQFDGGNMSMSQFRDEILRERAAELYMEGHRFFDITRMGVYDENCKIVLGDIDGQRQPNDYFWPIPITEISANPNIN